MNRLPMSRRFPRSNKKYRPLLGIVLSEASLTGEHMKVNWEKLREKVLATDKEVLKKAIQVDGHTIYKPEKFLDAGLDASIVKAFTKKMESGEHPKEKIYVEGREVESLEGVYGLSVIEFVASCFDVDSWKSGRGSRADHLHEQLLAKWG
jgi:hypothetical protein